MPKSPPIHRWRAFSLLAVAAFMTVMDLTIVNTALPTIGRELHFSQTSLLWVVTAYELAYGGFLLLGGRAADLLGRRRVIIAGLAVFTAASLGASLAGSEAILIAMRAIQGFGAAMFLPAALSTVRNMFAEGAERNKALGIWGALAALGATAGLVFGGLLTRFAGWQYVFLLNVPVGVVALLLVRRVVPETRVDTARRRYDPLGAVAVTAGLVVLAYAIAQAPRVGWGASRTVAELAIGAAVLGTFLVIERRGEAPLMPLRIFRLQTLAGANAVGFLLGASFYSFIFIGTLYMQQVLGYSALQGGFAWAASGVASMLFAGISQALVTKVSAKLVMAFGMAVLGVGIFWTAQAPVHGHFLGDLFGPFLVAVGMGTAFTFIPIQIAALAGVAEREAGLASGLIYTSQELGGAIGIAIASSIAATHYTTLVHSGDTVRVALTGGFHSALWVSGAIALLAIPVTFLLIRNDEMATAVAATTLREPQPEPAT
ncbi:MAG TPA: MFS transporter [Solirubrobacteraceae bacterium]|jgi:EmrB/QacA subfamily drug resistance transporter